MRTLQQLAAAISALVLEGTTSVDYSAEPWKHPPVPESQVDPATMDKPFVQLDGSRWVTWEDPTWVPVTGLFKYQRIYGYFSKEKDPVVWDKMVKVFIGRSAKTWEQAEVEIQALIDSNGKMAIYRNDPNSWLSTNERNPENLFMIASGWFAAALPACPPGPAPD